MPYHIKKPGIPSNAGIGDIYYTGGSLWDEDYANRKQYTNKATADAKIVNTNGKNGGFTGASVVTE
tara:strand:- start:326 stop:523 length:198 start_codon:yes stop_codon:yes gene_type:complete